MENIMLSDYMILFVWNVKKGKFMEMESRGGIA
jgi:hypothetical protein